MRKIKIWFWGSLLRALMPAIYWIRDKYAERGDTARYTEIIKEIEKYERALEVK